MKHLAIALGKEWEERANALRGQLCDLIDSLPDAATGVTLMPETLMVCTVPFSSLQSNSWNPNTYMTAGAKRELKEVVMKAHITNLDGIFRNIIESGKLRLSTGKLLALPTNFIDDLRVIWFCEGIAYG